MLQKWPPPQGRSRSQAFPECPSAKGEGFLPASSGGSSAALALAATCQKAALPPGAFRSQRGQSQSENWLWPLGSAVLSHVPPAFPAMG